MLSWGEEGTCQHSVCNEGKAGAGLTEQEGLTGRKRPLEVQRNSKVDALGRQGSAEVVLSWTVQPTSGVLSPSPS